MKKLNVAICDEDQAYVEALLEYVIRQAGQTLEVTVYHELSAYQNRTKTYDVALLTQPFWETKENIEDGSVLRLYFSGGEKPNETEDVFIIAKYQRADELVRQIFEKWENLRSTNEVWHRFGRNKELYGVYAPGGHDKQILFSLLLARELAREKKVLYVNLMECSALSLFCTEKWKKDLGDLMSVMLREGGNFRAQLESMVHTMEHVFYLPPMRNPVNLYEIDAHGYERFVAGLLEETDYEVTLFDFGSMVAGFYELLGQMDGLYCLTRSGRFLEKQQENFMQCIKQYDETLQERVWLTDLPQAERMIGEGVEVLKQQQYGAFGDFVRQMIEKGGEHGAKEYADANLGDQGTDFGKNEPSVRAYG